MLALLDELLKADVEQAVPNVRDRALLQHDLWSVFDWTTKTDRAEDLPARIELRRKLAIAIQKLALSSQQIAALPSNLIGAAGDDGPPNVFDKTSRWTSIGIPGATPVAEAHLKNLGGRSAFGIFISIPEGRKAAIKYLERLAEAPYPPARTAANGAAPNEFEPPQFSAGTKVALLRQMLLIDNDGQLVGSPIVEELQVRKFVTLAPKDVQFQEFSLDREDYIAEPAKALRAVGPEETEPLVFLSKEIDFFELPRNPESAEHRPQPPILKSCFGCHREPGVLSMNSFTRAFSAVPANNPKLADLSLSREATLAIDWKKSQASWGMLRGYWETNAR
jgi:hypothetical protein